VAVRPSDVDRVLFEYAEGTRRDVIGSPHFFTPTGDYFCPSLDVHRDDRDHLVVAADPAGSARLLDSCFSEGEPTTDAYGGGGLADRD
jgi:hypothetical protein